MDMFEEGDVAGMMRSNKRGSGLPSFNFFRNFADVLDNSDFDNK